MSTEKVRERSLLSPDPRCLGLEKVELSTEERRKELIKFLHQIVEEGRISVRSIRRDGNDQIKKMQNEQSLSEDNVKIELGNIQDLTNDFIEKLNNLQSDKEKEIMN